MHPSNVMISLDSPYIFRPYGSEHFKMLLLPQIAAGCFFKLSLNFFLMVLTKLCLGVLKIEIFTNFIRFR